MTRPGLFLILILIATGCGSRTVSDGSGVAVSSTKSADRPAWETSTSPPPASLETATGTTVLTFGSYCWSVTTSEGGTSGCGDSAPFDLYKDLAVTRVADGDTVTLVLALMPSKPTDVTLGKHHILLPAATRSEFVIHGHGILEVHANFPQGDVSYGIRIERPAASG